MIKIGILLGSQPHAGGVFQYNQSVIEAAAALPKDRFTVVVAYTSQLWSQYLEPYRFEKLLVPRGVVGPALARAWRRFSLPIGLWRTFCLQLDTLSRTLYRQRCDLWIFPSEDPWGYQVPVPSLVSIHDLMHRYERRFPEVSANGEFQRRDRNYRNICAWAKGVLVDSELGRKQLSDCYPIDPERIYPLPYIAPSYMRQAEEGGAAKGHHDLPAKYLFYPAQFWEHKNHRRLIAALSLVKKQCPDVKLVLAGSHKNGYQAARQLVSDLGLENDVLFLGYVPDGVMPALYRGARALVMPTFFGPTNIPPLEAFVAGCPVAVSGIYGMREQCGEAALYFDPESTEGLAACITALWTDDDLCTTLREEGRRKAASWGQPQFNERFRSIVETAALP